MAVPKLANLNGRPLNSRQIKDFFRGPFDKKKDFWVERAREKKSFCQKNCFCFLCNELEKVFLTQKMFLFFVVKNAFLI